MTRIKGRGAASNPEGRFEKVRRERRDDGWFPDDLHGAGRPATMVTEERARSIIARNASPDVPFDRSINPYRGCEHGCVYCYARPSHAYLNLSPGLDFETKLFAKTNAAERLRATLAKRGYRPEPINIGANTDPYQPIERRYRITRELLEPRASAPHRRIQAIRTLSEAGVPVGVLVSPVIPAVTDAELEEILAQARAAGATTTRASACA